MPLNVEIKDCYLYTGRKFDGRPCGSELSPKLPSLVAAPLYGLRISWPREAAFLSLKGEVFVGSSSNASGQFLPGRPGVVATAQQLGILLPERAQEENNTVISAAIAKGARLLITFEVDTDNTQYIKAPQNPAFLAVAENPVYQEAVRSAERRNCGEDPATLMPVRFDPESSTLALLLPVVYFKQGEHTPLREPDEIRLTLSNVLPPPAYEGYVAIDLGNTGSSLACVDRSSAGRNLAGRVKLLRLDTDADARSRLETRSEPIRSNLRVDRVRVKEFANASWHPKIALWVIDRLAENPGIGELIVGPKRLLAGRDWEAPRTLQVYNVMKDIPQASVVPLRVPKRLLAELFLCRVLEKFREASNREPLRLAITYPTTYTRRELNQLCQVVQRAWLRLRYKPQEEVAPSVKRRMEAIDQERVTEKDEGICLLLDEATAAAFYFLYRRIFDRPGGLPRFRYVYPHGLNMLLYDCGGGTTDIALVRAVVKPESPQFLTIRVLDRTGLRDFGGDNITVAVFRVLKARLALDVASRTGDYGALAGEFPTAEKGARLDEFLRTNEDAINKVVPTKFDPDRPNADMLRNQARTQALWRWAEWLKADLSRRADEPAVAFEPPMDLRQVVGELIRVGYTEEGVTQFIEEIGKEVERWMVDALIRGTVERSVRKCNKLISRPRQADIEAPPPPGEAADGPQGDGSAPPAPEPAEEEDTLDVHWIVTAGNASRYPLILETLKGHLDIAFRNSRFEPLDYENLKHAVAKGAALAFKAINQAQNIRVRFTDNLTNRLPYALGYKDENWDRHSILFRENDLYARMRPRLFEVVPKATGPSSPRQNPPFVNVDRRWPGDDEFDGHLQFEFPGGVKAPVALQYSPESQDFDLVEQGSVKRKGIPHEIAPEMIYIPPMQRGDL